jgi:stage V sporulation protein D (sporulation-specific penicillin-binding protein)
MANLRNMRASSAALLKARPDASRRRALVIISLLVFWMLVITTRLVYLQTFQHESLARRARVQQQDAVETSPLRGLVLDRQGRELARSIDTESFFAVPADIKDEEQTAGSLAPLVGVDQEWTRRH